MQPQHLSYGGARPATQIQPAQPLSYAQSIGRFGSAPAPAPAPVPTPQPYSPSGPAPAMGLMPETPAAAPGVGDVAAPDAATPFSWGGALKGAFVGEDGGFNMQGIGTLAKGIGALGGIYSSFQQNRIARDALDFQKKAFQTNLSSQIGSYNTALEDRIRARHAQEGRGSAATERYIDQHRLKG